MPSGMTSAFREAVRDRDRILEELASEGRRLLGYFCTYTPIELLSGMGFVPVRIMGDAAPVEKAYALTPDFICPFLRKAVEKGLNGGYRHLAGVIQGYTCDVTCGLINIWEENIGGEIFHLLPLPYLRDGESRSYLRSALLELIHRLGLAGGNFSLEELQSAMDLYAGIRKLLAGVYARRSRHCLPLDAEDLHAVVLAGFFIPPERYLRMLEDLMQALPDRPHQREGMPVLVSGSLVEDPRVMGLIEESGGMVVADDLCTGIRSFDPVDGKGADPLERLMDRMMNHFPCPSRSSAEERIPRILHLMRESDAKGVVFLFQKFCTPHLADYPYLGGELRKMGIPCTMVEMEESGLAEERLKTRLEGFFETMGA
jgi:benzoyl-CoA reductase/2-hydroxyglutaryl-CoA dehydratase subunit BcrC/BadD/HgdB